MENSVCPQCGAPIDAGAAECRFCGEKLNPQPAAQANVQPNVQPAPQQVVQHVYVQQPTTAINPAWPIKNKIVAGLLGIFLGGIGIHKFYMGKIGMGILYILFCWTGIPSLVGFIEGIIYLCSNDENFQLKHHVRLK